MQKLTDKRHLIKLQFFCSIPKDFSGNCFLLVSFFLTSTDTTFQKRTLIFLSLDSYLHLQRYDAQIFSITTLLSSHVLYNTVKLIDQNAVDYLGLLTRRTQLFKLKSEIHDLYCFQTFDFIFLF